MCSKEEEVTMSTHNIDPLLLAATSALLLVSLYALRLWLRFWFMRKVVEEVTHLVSQHEGARRPEAGSSCGGILLLLLVIATGIDILLRLR